MSGLRRVWGRITEPRHLKAFYFALYAVTGMIGAASLLVPPRVFDGAAGPVSAQFLAWLLVVGGLGGVVTVFPGWWWAERLLAIAPTLLGLTIMIVVLSILHLQHAIDDESRLTQIGIALLASSPFVLRFLLIREYSYEPRR
jgi:hypothetical protein